MSGSTLLVGAIADGLVSAKGAAYVYEHQTDGSWVEVVKLTPPHVDAWAFGWAVDVEGDRLVVGAKGASSLGGGMGMAFVYERESGTWIHKATLQPSISQGGDGFGNAVSLDGERLVVGASYAWTSSSPYPGRAFVFERQPSGTAWTEVAALAPPDLTDGNEFGRAVALQGDLLLVGAPVHQFLGAVYVFERVGTVWTQIDKLMASDPQFLKLFGWCLDFEGSRAAIGAQFDNEFGDEAGAVYVFEEGVDGWEESYKLTPNDLSVGETFGYAIDLDGSDLLVGAPVRVAGVNGPGRAILFDLDLQGPSLIGQPSAVSISSGDVQTLHLGACPGHAGDFYVLAGSATGAAPGFLFSGLSVPLNPDAYFFHTVNHVGATPLADGLGTFDADGRGEATFALPGGSNPSLAGLVLHHAYAVLDGATLQMEAVSNAVPVSLTP